MIRVLNLEGDIKLNKLGPVISKNCSYKNREKGRYIEYLNKLNLEEEDKDKLDYINYKYSRNHKLTEEDESILRYLISLLYKKRLVSSPCGIEVDSHYDLELNKLINSTNKNTLYKVKLDDIMDLVFTRLIYEIEPSINKIEFNDEIENEFKSFFQDIIKSRDIDINSLVGKDLYTNNYIKLLYNLYNTKSLSNDIEEYKNLLIETVIDEYNTIKKYLVVLMNDYSDISVVSVGLDNILIKSENDLDIKISILGMCKSIKMEMI